VSVHAAAKANSLSMFGTSVCNTNWPVVFGTFRWFSETSWIVLVVRVMLTMICASHVIAFMILMWEDGHWFQNLSNWSLLIETSYFLVVSICTFIARKHIIAMGGSAGLVSSSSGNKDALPVIAKLSWILFYMAVPLALTVAMLFWILVKPFWASGLKFQYYTFAAHGGNVLILLVDFSLNRMPFYPRHAIIFFFVALTYVFWTLIHFWGKVGRHQPCKKYPRDECPIYGVLDWHLVGRTTVVLTLVLFCFVPLVQVPLILYKRSCNRALSKSISSLQRCEA